MGDLQKKLALQSMEKMGTLLILCNFIDIQVVYLVLLLIYLYYNYNHLLSFMGLIYLLVLQIQYKRFLLLHQKSQLTSNLKPNKKLTNNLIKKMQSDSDSQTIDQIHSPITIQYLVNQNKMKQIALNKATNLIDLLKIQLEVQKNSHEQSIKIMEEDLRYRYEMEIMRLNQKIQSLQYQLKLLEMEKEKEKGNGKGKNKLNQMTIRKSNTYFQPNNSNSNGKFKFKDFTGRESPMLMMRTNNSEQLQKQKRRKFSNKKIISKNSISRIQNNNGQQGPQQSRHENQLQFSYKEKLQKFNKNLLISWILTTQRKHQQEFQALTQQYQNSLIQIIQQKEKIKSSIFQINYMFQKQRKKSIQQQKKQNQYKKFIEAQKQFIIQLSKELQQVHEAFGQMRGSLSTFVLFKNINYQQQEVISGRHVLQELNLSQNYLRAILMQNRKKIKEKVQLMENQNIQLKDILDNMIRLVKSNKKIQIL